MRLKPNVRDLIVVNYVIIGSLLCATNINTFTSVRGLFPDGFTGLTIFIQRCAEKYMNLQVPYPTVNFALNAIPACIGYKTAGEKFTLYSRVMVALTDMFVEILPVTNITEDTLLITISSGILQGIALDIALRGNASSSEMDFIAMWISQRTNQPAWNYILAMNAAILAVARHLSGWSAALYSIISRLCSTQVINSAHTHYKRMTPFIVTSNPDTVTEEIQNPTHHGVTRLKGISTYYGRPRTMLYMVTDPQNIKGLVTRVREIDQTSFVSVTKTENVEGKSCRWLIE